MSEEARADAMSDLRDEVRTAIQAIGELVAESPPDTWDWRDPFGYDHHGHGKPRDIDFVDAPDDSNRGDMHAHGRAVGRWSLAREMRAIARKLHDALEES
jgi:hypothetical protein